MNKSLLFKKIAPALVIATLPCMLNSCVGPSLLGLQQNASQAIANSGGTAADQQKFAADQQNTVNQGTGVGAVVGAAAGAALARQVPFVGGVLGMMVGSAAGNALGQHVAAKKALAKTSDANLDASIKEAQHENDNARKEVASLQKRLTDLKDRGIKAKMKNDTKELSRVKADLTKLDKEAASQINDINTEITQQQQVASKVGPGNSRYSGLSSGANNLSETRAQLESTRKQIASTMSSL